MISIWEKESFFAPQDVVIIGGGLVGLWSAICLAKKNPALKITIVDRGVVPTGASTRNAGFACFGSLSEIMYDIKTMGLDATLLLVEQRHKGLERIKKNVGKKTIDFELCGGYELFGAESSYTKDELQNSIGYINTLLKDINGEKQTYKLVDKKLADFGFGKTEHLVLNRQEGALHSGKLVQALVQKAASLGVQMMGNTAVQSYVKEGAGFEIQTNQNFALTTSKILICTNAFAKELLPDEDIVPARGQIIVTSPIRNLPFEGTFHSDEGYYYFRNLNKGVLLGGARNQAFDEEQTTDMSTSAFIQQHLERYLAEVVLPDFSGQYTIEHRWAGIMGMGTQKTPVVKEAAPGVFCAIGMGGMGVALAPIVAQEVAALMV